MSDVDKAQFSGWAKVSLFGHTVEYGIVETMYFGNNAMFRITIPPVLEHEEAIPYSGFILNECVGAGSVIRYSSQKGRERIVGINSVFSIDACTESDVFDALKSYSEPIAIVTKITPSDDLPF